MKTVRLDVVSRLFDDKGDETSIALTRDNLVIEVHQSQIHPNDLYYTLGKIDLGTPVPFTSAYIGHGTLPCVAASVRGGSLAVVEVHERSTPGSLGYRVGMITGTKIDWPGNDTEYDKGGNRPSIALEDLRAVGVHQTDEGGTTRLYYKVGTVDPRTRTIANFNPATRLLEGSRPHVAVGNGHAVVVYIAEEDRLKFLVGRIAGNSIVWGTPQQYATLGLRTGVAMNNEGRVFLLWSDNSVDNPRTFSRSAMLDAAGLTLRVADDEYVVNTTSGIDPTESPQFINSFGVAMNDTLAIQSVSTGSSYLGSSSSLIADRTHWMEANLDRLRDKSLHDITIPGSHDASTYKIVDCSTTGHDCNSRTQRNDYYDQLVSGIRYFDVRPLYYRRVLTTGHIDDSFRGCNSAPLGEILDDVARFMATGAREIVILKFSHLRDRDTEQLSFTRAQKTVLVNLVRAKLGPYLYTGPVTGTLAFTPIGTLLAGKGIVLPVFDEFRNDKDLLGNGLYTYADDADPNRDRDADLTVYDVYADDNSVDAVYSDQFEKLRNHKDADVFLFSATLTQNLAQAAGCRTKLVDATVALASRGNASLATKFNEAFAKRTFTRHPGPGILFVDLASDFVTDAALYLNQRRDLGDKLFADRRDYLIPGDGVYSFNADVVMNYQADGDLVLVSLIGSGGVIARLGTKGPAWRCIMQEDGNFVVYSAPGVSVYQSGTSGNPGALLKVQDDRKVAVYSKDGRYLKTVLIANP